MSTLHRPKLFWLLIALLALELALAVGLTVVLLIELIVGRPASMASAVALTVLAAIAAAWVASIIVGALRGQGWVRGAAIVWQVLQFAVGLGAVQGGFADAAAAWGWPLIAVAVVTFILLLAPGVFTPSEDRVS